MKPQARRQPDVKQPSGETLRQALAFVSQQLDTLQPLLQGAPLKPFSHEYTMWERVTLAGLQDYFGRDSEAYKWVYLPQEIALYLPLPGVIQQAKAESAAYQARLTNQRTGLKSVLARYRTALAERDDQPDRGARRARAFISHGGQKPSLTLIQDFLRALGVEPIVVEKRASEGREVHENVDTYRKQSDFALILLTKDFKDSEGTWRPSGSVEVELGELRQQFGSHVIYLKEEGVALPTMAATPVHESFTEDNMGPAFVKIVTELHAWGWLAVSRPGAD